MSGMQRTIDLVYFNAGGGHRASALALEAAIERAGLPWTVRRVNLRAVLDPKDSFRKLTGMDPEDVYNKRLARGWTLGLAQELKLLQGMIRWGHATLLRQLRQHWLATGPDMVVSLIPNFNRALCESLGSTLPGVPWLVCSSFAKVDQAVGALTGQLDRYQAATRKVRNRAMFELPGILEGILARAEALNEESLLSVG